MAELGSLSNDRKPSKTRRSPLVMSCPRSTQSGTSKCFKADVQLSVARKWEVSTQLGTVQSMFFRLLAVFKVVLLRYALTCNGQGERL
jgi:hypothetical protein